MSYTMHGEMTADGQRLVVLPVGDPEMLRPDGPILERMLRLTPVIRPTNPPGGMEMELTWPAVVQLSTEYGEHWRPGPHLTAWIENEVRRRYAEPPTELSFPIPSRLADAGIAPYPHQIKAAQIIATTSGGRAVLWHEPRTGKTFSAVLGLREIASTWWPELGTVQKPIIVLCPASVVSKWVEAFHDWWPNVVAVAWRGTSDARRRRMHTAGVYVASWDVAAKDATDLTLKRSPLTRLQHGALVVDEAHRAKNGSAKRTHAMQRLARPARVFIELTGTPQAHNFLDLQPRIQFLHHPSWLSSRDRMRDRWGKLAAQEYGEPKVLGMEPRTADEFYTCMAGQWHWQKRSDVVVEPPKVYKVVEVDIPDPWRAVYDAVETQMLALLPDGGELPSFGTLQQLGQLQLLSKAAGDVEITESFDEETGELKKHYHVILKKPSWIVDAAVEQVRLRDWQQAVYAPSRQLVMLAGERLEEVGYRVGYVVGGISRRKIDRMIDAFQAGKLDMICATTGAGGEAITLHAAGTLHFLQRPWSGIESGQSEDRTSGIGAPDREETEIIDYVTRRSIDQRVRARLKEKGGQLSELVRDPRIVAELLGGARVIKIKREA